LSDLTDRQRQRLAELRRVFQENPLERYNNPALPKVHQKQIEFHAIKAPPLGVKALIAANRSGKTVACVVDDIIQLVPEELVPEHLKAFKKWDQPITIWIGAPKNDTHFKNTVPLLRKFIPKAALIDGKFEKSFKSQPAPELRLANGSTVAFKTYDQDLDAWASAEVHRIHWDEEPNTAKSAELRSEASARLVSTNGDEIIGMTPLLGYSWVHDDVWMVRDTDPLVSVVQMGMDDNPWNSPEAIAKFSARLTDDEKRMRLHGEFVHLGGMFFEEFRDKLHVVDPIDSDHLKGQEVVIGIDPGRNRTGVVWVGFDKENSAVVFDEFNPHQTVVPDVAAEIKRRNKFWGIKDPTYVIDPSSRNTSAINADQVEAAYAREEIYCQWGQNSRAAGILEMKRRLQEKDKDGQPDPTLVFTRKCPETIKQCERYRRDPKSKDEWAAVPQTDNTRFDCVDATRYSVMARTFYSPEEEPYRPPAFQPNFQPPYAEETFQAEPPPMGAFS
jgi:phage terminase large subunit-like protein